MELTDFLALTHPAIAVFFVFPLIGIVVNFAWSTRQRRLQTSDGGKSKIPPVVGTYHPRLLLNSRRTDIAIIEQIFICTRMMIFG